MDKILFTFVALAVSACFTAAQPMLKADISMGGVSTTILFAAAPGDPGGSVIATVQTTNQPSSKTFSVDIRSNWIDYDVLEKCTDAMLGSSILPSEISFNNANRQFTIPTGLPMLEAKSVLFTSLDNKRYCASIWNPQSKYSSAVAYFSGQMAGVVHFRQAGQTTFVQSQLGWDGSVNGLSWKVTDGIETCNVPSKSLSEANAFDPGSSGGFPVGDLAQRLGSPIVGANKNSLVKKSYSGSYLALDSSARNIIGKFVIVYSKTDDSKAACGKIQLVHPRKAKTLFSHRGISGYISFSQSSPFDPTETKVELQGLRAGAKGYHVHLYPVPIPTQKDQNLCSNDVVAGHFNPYAITNFPAATVGTQDQYEIGDLSSKYGTLAGYNDVSKTYTDWNLPLFGRNSIVGRSIVIHRDDNSASRWVCSNILLDGKVRAGVATFKFPVYGRIYFTQAMDSPDSDTWIFAQLNNFGGGSPPQTTNHHWNIHTGKIADTMLAPGEKRCSSAEGLFDPDDGEICTPESAADRRCIVGDLTDQFGTLSIGTDTHPKAFFTDKDLPLSGDHSIIGKSVVIARQSSPDDFIACADIEPLDTPMLKAPTPVGSVSFTQQPGFGQRPTTVSLDLQEFDTSTGRLQINYLPKSSTDSKCTKLGLVYNPLRVSGSPSDGATDDQYRIGDMRIHGTSWVDLNLPLIGKTGIRHHTLLVRNAQSKVIGCGTIQDTFSGDAKGYQVSARAIFGNPLAGYIDLFQTLFEDGTTTDTSVVVMLRNTDNQQTPNHNWHVHVSPVSGDANANTVDRCQSTGPHYDPYMTKVEYAATVYNKYCSATNPLRCEVGDLASKLGTYSLGIGKALFTDVDLPLNGKYKVQGRSIVVHVENKGAARFACANIIPVTNLALTFTFRTPSIFDLPEAVVLYAFAIGIPEDDLMAEVITSTPAPEGETTVHLYFLGFSRELRLAQFQSYFRNVSNRGKFGDYAPLNTPEMVEEAKAGNEADTAAVSTGLLLVALVVNTLVFHS